METQPHNWQEIEACLRKPFKPEEICFRLEGPAQKVGERFFVRAIPYVAAHAVQARLDQAVGVQNWTYRWTPVSLLKGRVVTVKGTLSVCGCVKEEEGHALKGGTPGETVAADGLRSCALLFGVGRYLLKQGALPAEVESTDPNRWVLSETVVARLRAMFSDAAEHEAVAGEVMALASTEAPASTAEESEAMAEPTGGPIEEASSPILEMAEAAIASEEPPAAVAGARNAEAGAAEESVPEMAEAVEVTSAETAEPDAEPEEEEAPADGEEAEETEVDAPLTTLETEETMEEVEEGEPEEESFEEDAMEEDDSELADEIAEEAEEPAPQAVVHPEKVAAIRWLCNKLEVDEPVGLEAMTPAQAEGHLARLMAAWGEKQREASTPRVSVSSSAPAASKPAAASPPTAQASSELSQVWNEYVRLFNNLYGHDPDPALRTTLKLKTFGFMIQGLNNQLAARDALPQGASRP